MAVATDAATARVRVGSGGSRGETMEPGDGDGIVQTSSEDWRDGPVDAVARESQYERANMGTCVRDHAPRCHFIPTRAGSSIGRAADS
jgi:hypothetical protein